MSTLVETTLLRPFPNDHTNLDSWAADDAKRKIDLDKANRLLDNNLNFSWNRVRVAFTDKTGRAMVQNTDDSVPPNHWFSVGITQYNASQQAQWFLLVKSDMANAQSPWLILKDDPSAKERGEPLLAKDDGVSIKFDVTTAKSPPDLWYISSESTGFFRIRSSSTGSYISNVPLTSHNNLTCRQASTGVQSDQFLWKLNVLPDDNAVKAAASQGSQVSSQQDSIANLTKQLEDAKIDKSNALALQQQTSDGQLTNALAQQKTTLDGQNKIAVDAIQKKLDEALLAKTNAETAKTTSDTALAAAKTNLESANWLRSNNNLDLSWDKSSIYLFNTAGLAVDTGFVDRTNASSPIPRPWCVSWDRTNPNQKLYLERLSNETACRWLIACTTTPKQYIATDNGPAALIMKTDPTAKGAQWFIAWDSSKAGYRLLNDDTKKDLQLDSTDKQSASLSTKDWSAGENKQIWRIERAPTLPTFDTLYVKLDTGFNNSNRIIRPYGSSTLMLDLGQGRDVKSTTGIAWLVPWEWRSGWNVILPFLVDFNKTDGAWAFRAQEAGRNVMTTTNDNDERAVTYDYNTGPSLAAECSQWWIKQMSTPANTYRIQNNKTGHYLDAGSPAPKSTVYLRPLDVTAQSQIWTISPPPP